MIRTLLITASAIAAALLVVLFVRAGASLPFATAASVGISAPMIAAALAFPAVYLLWEQSEL